MKGMEERTEMARKRGGDGGGHDLSVGGRTLDQEIDGFGELHRARAALAEQMHELEIECET